MNNKNVACVFTAASAGTCSRISTVNLRRTLRPPWVNRPQTHRGARLGADHQFTMFRLGVGHDGLDVDQAYWHSVTCRPVLYKLGLRRKYGPSTARIRPLGPDVSVPRVARLSTKRRPGDEGRGDFARSIKEHTVAAVAACGLFCQALRALESPAEGYAKRWSSAVVSSFRPGYTRECWGTRSFDRSVRHDVDTMLARATPDDSPTATEGMLRSLPPPVQRYLSYAGVVGKPIARTVHLAQSGRMRLGPGQPWLSLRAKQYYSVQPPGFVWDGTVRAGPVPIGRARDMYVDGKGSMLVKALSLFGVVDAQGVEIDPGAMMRYLSEMVWFPSAFLLGNVSFEAVDEGSARVTLTDQGRTASGTLTVDPDGRLTGFVRRAIPDGGREPRPRDLVDASDRVRRAGWAQAPGRRQGRLEARRRRFRVHRRPGRRACLRPRANLRWCATYGGGI